MIYPVPAEQTVTVSGVWEKANLSLVDGTGRLIWQSDVTELTTTIPLSELSEGVYRIILQIGEGLVSRKILVLH